MGTGLVVVGVLAVLLIVAVVIFNDLIRRRQLANNGWADIDVQLKRRADLVPNLVAAVQAYAAHERQLFSEIAEKRTTALAAGDDTAQRSAAESALGKPLGKLMALAEGYPQLKASENFLRLQSDLADTENKIEMARRFYNGAVRELNTAVETFPANLIAGASSISARRYFEIEMGDRAVPSVGGA